MSQKNDSELDFKISPMTVDDVITAAEMRFDVWLDTYVNDEIGVTADWLKTYIAQKMSDNENEVRKVRFLDTEHQAGWVARDLNGEIIGSAIGYVDENGIQNVGALYINKEWHGKGVSNILMQKIMGWLDDSKPIQLTVTVYNERAKSFYRKWGFTEVPGSNDLVGEKMPIITMIRKGDK